MPIIEVAGLVRRYGDFVAVNAFDLTVERGECLAVLGPNGAGKTTMIEILEGYRHRDAGTVLVLDQDPATARRAWRERIGIVLQSNDDLTHATVREALTHFAHFYPRPRAVDETLVLVGLVEQADQRVSRLSGGQRRRLDVGLGVIGRPEVLFLDEPTTGFDPEARRVFWELIRSLQLEGVTIVLTTHYLEEADALADRVVVLANGRKVADTTPDELGGRHDTRVLVRWREAERDCVERTATPTSFIRALSDRFGGEVPGLEVSRLTLEEAYLQLLDHEAR